jgi:hypothetical protein
MRFDSISIVHRYGHTYSAIYAKNMSMWVLWQVQRIEKLKPLTTYDSRKKKRTSSFEIAWYFYFFRNSKYILFYPDKMRWTCHSTHMLIFLAYMAKIHIIILYYEQQFWTDSRLYRSPALSSNVSNWTILYDEHVRASWCKFYFRSLKGIHDTT